MKIALWGTMAAVGVALAACGHGDNNTASMTMGNSPPVNSGPTGPVSTDFVAFVNAQVLTQPAFGSAPTPTTSLTTDFALGTPGAFSYTFSAGDALHPGTYQAAVACTQVGTAHCNPTVSADLNSTLN
jgi:hypothetical protein